MALEDMLEIKEDKQPFQLFFLKDRDERAIEIIELERIDFNYIKRRLDNGESVFITRSNKQEAPSSRTTVGDVFFNIDIAKNISRRNAARPWYFTHA